MEGERRLKSNIEDAEEEGIRSERQKVEGKLKSKIEETQWVERGVENGRRMKIAD